MSEVPLQPLIRNTLSTAAITCETEKQNGENESGKKRERIVIELMTSDRKLKASREGSK